MDSLGGGLFFDSGINKNPYIQGLIDMENRTLLFQKNVLAGNATIQKSYDRLAQSIGNGRFSRAIDTSEKKIENFVNTSIANTARLGTGFNNFSTSANANLRSLEVSFNAINKASGQAIASANGGVNSLTQNANANGQALTSTFSKLGAAVAGYFTLQTLNNFKNKVIEVTSQVQMLNVAYSTILGSKRQADRLYAETVELARTTPFSLMEVAQSTKQLLAYGFGAQEVTGTLSKLGDIAAGVGAPLGDIAYLYGTLKTQGRAYAMDIRQFTGRGIPIIAELAKQFGTTEANVNKLVEAGKIGFPEVEKAFNSLTGAGGQFFNLMQEQSKTIGGQISNLGDNLDQLFARIGKGNQGIINDGIAGLNLLIDNYDNIITTLEGLILLYGSYRAAQILLTASTYAQAAATALETAAYYLLRNGFTALTSAAVVARLQTVALTAGIAALSVIVYALTANLNAEAAAAKDLNDINAEGIKNTQAQISRLDSLQKVITSVTRSEEDRLSAVNKLREATGERLKQYSDEEILAGKAQKAIQSYTDTLLQNAKAAAAQTRLTELQAQLLATDPSANDGLNYQERVKNAYDNIPLRERAKLSILRGFNSGSDAKVQGEGELRDYRTFLQKQVNAITNSYGKSIDDLNAGIDNKNDNADIKAALAFQKLLKDASKNFNALVKTSTGLLDFKAIQKGLEDALETPKISDTQIQKIKNQLTSLQPFIDKYSLKYDAKQEKIGETEFEKRSAIYQKLADLEQKRVADSKTEYDKEVANTRAMYDAIIKEAEKYNRTAKGKKIGPEFFTSVQAASNSAVNQLQVNPILDDAKNVFNTQKTLFTEYEKYKTEVGATEANRRYAKELAGFTSYVNYLQSVLDGLDGKTDAYSNGLRDILSKELPKANRDALKTQQENFSKLLIDNQSYEQRRVSMIEVYTQRVNQLVAAGNLEQAEEVRKSGEEQLNILASNESDKIARYQRYTDNIIELTRQQAKEQVKVLQDVIASGVLPDAEATKVQGTIDKIQGALKTNGGLNKAYVADLKKQKDLLTAQLKPLSAGSQKFNEITAKIGEINRKIKEAQNPLSKWAGYADLASQSFSTLASSLQDISPAAADALNSLSKISGIAGGVFDTISSFKSGDVVGAIGSAVGVIGGIFSLFGGNDAENRKYRDDLQMKSIEAVNKLLERQIKLAQEAYGPDRISAYLKGLVDIKNAQADVTKQLSGKYSLFGDKAIDELITKSNNDGKISPFFKPILDGAIKSGQVIDLATASLEQLQSLLDRGLLDDKTAALAQSLISLGDQYTETLNTLKAETTGTTFESLTNDIVSLFENATTSAEDFADNFEKIMQKAVLNAFKRNSVEKQLQGFFDQFYEASKSGDGLDSTEISQLQALYNAFIANAQSDFDKLKAATGISFGSGNLSEAQGIDGAVKRELTEQTGTALEGLFRSYYDLSKRIYALQQASSIPASQRMAYLEQSILLQTEIRDYTLRTANNTDRLENIEAALVKMANAPAGNGAKTPGFDKGLGGI